MPMAKGQTYSSETKRFRDTQTNAELTQITDHPSMNHSFYFLNPSCTYDGQTYIFVSDRSGQENLYAADAANDAITQLTDIDNLGTFSPTPAANQREIYFTAGNEVRAVDVDTLEERVLATCDGSFGNLHLSKDGDFLVTGASNGSGRTITVVSTDGSGSEPVYMPPRSVGHIQFCPTDSGLILYSSDIDQRMWLVTRDGNGDRPLYRHDASEWITHESWLGETDEVIFSQWPNALKKIHKDAEEASVVAPFNTWHASSRKDGSLIVCDTTCPDIGLQLIEPETGEHRPLCYPNSSNGGTRWAYNTPEAGTVTESTYGPQSSHPHPCFTHDGSKVIYTSDCTGNSQVYVVEVDI
jgi:oligogalacturonide lyase